MVSLHEYIHAAEGVYVVELVKLYPDYNITQMAATANVARTQLYRILARHNIKIPKYDFHTYSRPGVNRANAGSN